MKSIYERLLLLIDDFIFEKVFSHKVENIDLIHKCKKTDLVTFTEKTLNRKLHFCEVKLLQLEGLIILIYRGTILKLCRNCAFPQNFDTRKLAKIRYFMQWNVWIIFKPHMYHSYLLVTANKVMKYPNRQKQFSKELWTTLPKIPNFHLISWYENFVERHKFRQLARNSAETLRFHKITLPGN